jgi:adenine-specific DNA-methyltransferase
LDEANKKGIKWAISNFIKHKNHVNTIIEEWAIKNNYNIYNIQSDYSNLTVRAERSPEPTIEVLITNYN